MESLRTTSREIRDLITNAEIPDDLAREIRSSYGRLCSLTGGISPVSVRSSALQEDGEFSFAGQYSTFLNVHEEGLLQKYKEVVASLFNERALFYYKTKGFEEFEMAMPVGVLQMVDAKAGGVMYSRDPNNPKKDAVIVSAIRGLGVCVVDGTVTPEVYRVSSGNGGEVIEKSIPAQQSMAVCRADGGIDRVSVDPSALAVACLTDEQIKALAGYALALERHFGGPQDIEWAIDHNDRPFILQSRPLRITLRETAKPVPTRVKGYALLVEKGAIACKGIGFGTAHIVRTDEDLTDFPEGGVLIAKHTSTKFVTVMNKASAILTDVGATAGHMASLAREFDVPTILDTGTATSVIKNGQALTVDAINCNVYDGIVEELKEFAEKKEEPFKETHIFKTLEKVLKLIVPLSLIDPAAENFRAESCATLHDITRFCHEKVMDELFDVVDTSADDVGAVKLVAGIPTDIYLLDLGGAIEGAPKYLNPEHIRSVPFNAFLKGLTSMKWPEPRAFDVQGFLGAVAHTATVSEEELQKTAEKSFAFVTSHYMNFAIRLGYHLSTVEAFAGENINDNYIKFFFKGGGAVIDRRLRRVRLIREILKHMDFNVKATDDVLEASLMKYKKETILQKLETMGRFTVYTKQLDMVMYNDMITDHYIEEFCKQYVPKES
jgi:pyruvate,water dikinase